MNKKLFKMVFKMGIYIFSYLLILIPILIICSNIFAIDDREATVISLCLLCFYVSVILIVTIKKKHKNYAVNIKTSSIQHTYPLKIILSCTVLLVLVVTFTLIKIKTKPIPVPDNVVEFVQKYPEAKEFADNYPKYYNRDCKIDITSEIEARDIPLFIQWDKRWGYHEYGSSLIGISGCGPTCFSMVLCGLTKDSTYTPVYVADFSQQQGYYISGQGTSWDLFSNGASILGLNSESSSIDENYITNKLNNNTPLICSMKPGDFTYTGHFIVLVGFDSEGKVIVNDPNSPNNSSKHWELSILIPQIKAIWAFSLQN